MMLEWRIDVFPYGASFRRNESSVGVSLRGMAKIFNITPHLNLKQEAP